MDHTVEALVYVVEQSAAQVRTLGEKLETAKPKQAEAILRSLAKEGDGLSAGLTRLSQHVEEIPDDKAVTPKEPPLVDMRLINISDLLRAAIELGFCPRCGGMANAEITNGDRQV